MRRLTTSEKFADTCIMTVFCVIIASGLYCFILGVTGHVDQQDTHQNYFDGIALGEPCDIRDLKSFPYNPNGLVGTIEHTKGLLCYVYDTLFPLSVIHNGNWVYPDGKESSNFKGVWVYPHAPQNPFLLSDGSEVDEFLFNFPLASLTKNWKQYTNTVGKYSFKMPSTWTVRNNSDIDDGSITIEQRSKDISEEVGIGYQYNITYHPESDFLASSEYQLIKNAPGNWFIPDTSNDTFILSRSFELNGTPALLVQRGSNYTTENHTITLYVIKKDSYLTVEYTEYNDSSDFLIQVLIRTLKF